MIYESHGYYDRAFLSYDRVLKMNPENPKALYQKGTTLQGLGRNDEALECFGNALKLDPLNIYIWFSKALLLASLGRTGEAVEALDGALAIQDVPEIRRLRDSLLAGKEEEGSLPGA
jgi:tetratricopeptide (TPR) repeat protein